MGNFEIKKSVADVLKAKKELGFQAKTSLISGLRKTIEHYKRENDKA